MSPSPKDKGGDQAATPYLAVVRLIGRYIAAPNATTSSGLMTMAADWNVSAIILLNQWHSCRTTTDTTSSSWDLSSLASRSTCAHTANVHVMVTMAG